MATRRSFSTAAAPTTLATGINNAVTSLTVQDGSTYVDGTSGPSVLTVDRGKSNEERILYTSRVGNTFTGLTRGYNGTAAQDHTAGAIVEHTSTQQDFDEANAHIADTALDHHTQYVRTDGSRTITATQIFDANLNINNTGPGGGLKLGLVTGGVGIETASGGPATNYISLITANTWGIHTNTVQQVKIDDGGGVAGFTALSVRENAIVQRVLVGAAGSGPGGAGRALYLA